MMQKITWLMVLLCHWCWSQNQLQGRVYQSNTRESLAFANLKLQGVQTATLIADIDGQFHWKGAWQPQTVTASFVGYQSQTLPWPADGKLFFYLTPSNDALQEVVVAIKENPAWRIIRAAAARVELNNPENYPWFSYECYNKVQYNIRGHRVDSIRAAMDKRLQNSPLFLMESVTRRQFKAPNASTEEILANRVSGFKDPSFASLATDLQPFSLYQPHIDLLNVHYVNPLRKGSLKLYHYQLRDTLIMQGDSVFVIAYRPLKNTRFDGLKGVLYINNNGWALQNVTAEPAEPGKINVKIEQKYQRTSQGKWFPEQLNYELIFSEVPSPQVNMFVQGKSYISHVDLTPPVQPARFPLEKVWMSDQATRKDSLYWEAHRPELLLKPDEVAYAYEELMKVSPRFTIAAAFGNVHGVYKPGNVKLTPVILKNSQDYVQNKFNTGENPVDFVFHGGSGSTLEEIREAISYGVIKMNIDTDLQFAFTEGIRDYMVNKIDYLRDQIGNPEGADVPNKKHYDPRKWVREGELTFIKRLEQAFADLNNVNTL